MENIHEDEFPDEHSHEPKQTAEGVHGVFVTDEEGRHYYLEHKLTSEGIMIDLQDRYGEQLLATWAKTWDELGDFVYANDPMFGEHNRDAVYCNNCGDDITFGQNQNWFSEAPFATDSTNVGESTVVCDDCKDELLTSEGA